MKNQFSLLIFLLLSLFINDALFSRSTVHNCFVNYNVNNDVRYVKIYFRYYMNPGDTPPIVKLPLPFYLHNLNSGINPWLMVWSLRPETCQEHVPC
jgi:hypothetical protein